MRTPFVLSTVSAAAAVIAALLIAAASVLIMLTAEAPSQRGYALLPSALAAPLR